MCPTSFMRTTERPEPTPSPPQRQAWLGLFALLPTLLLFWAWQQYRPEGVYWVVDWVPSLGINLALALDGLSYLFVLLICGIGTLIQVYALSYLRGKAKRAAFHLYLTLFMLAMLGLVLSDNLILLFVFWELTTITSYLLIGFNHEDPTARRNALQAMLVTGAGGLALLAGLILLGEMTGSYRLSQILQQAPELQSHPLFLPSMVLVLLGGITKSAQFPFHFWLPGAMAAPTPVSAYLHSATMVKAGIYLLARLSPVYAHSDLWFYSLLTLGGITAIWSAILALKQTDLKLMLAYSTNTALGKLTMLLALGTDYAITAALLFIQAHALYKAALFMVVGNIDKATGTRDYRQLAGLRPVLLLSFSAAVLAALSKAGLPPLMGFLSKEYMYKAALGVGLLPSLLVMLANVMMVVLALAVVSKPFLGQQASDSKADSTLTKPIERDWGLWLPALLLALLSLLLPALMLGPMQSQILTPGSLAIAPEQAPVTALLWQGWNLPLLLSALTLLLGGVAYRYFLPLSRGIASVIQPLPQGPAAYQQLLDGMQRLGRWQTALLQPRTLSMTVLMFFAVIAALLLWPLSGLSWSLLPPLGQLAFYEVALALLLLAAVAACLLARSKLLAIAALGMVGFLSTLIFMLYSAPDVAKTQLLVETLLVVILMLLLRYLPSLDSVSAHPPRRRLLNAGLALAIGLSVTLLLNSVVSLPMDPRLTEFFAQNSVPGGHGRNIVNVILVDFRAFDTFGEVVVVVIAAIASISLLRSQRRGGNRVDSLIFQTTAHVVVVIMLMFSLYLLLRGHNAPGGGFIGALIAVIGFALLMLAESARYVRQRLRLSPVHIALCGMLAALLAGTLSLMADQPFLTGLWWKAVLPLGTPLLFDLGVYLAVFGAVLGILLRINEEMD
ncbi:hydrogen gas-evolving membrane-bound hydrogenase subunit E [Ferrimonas marina]|uniref:Multicomponent Na+:H+ antiporter subunit A n=1 Tax=Ferrimonas marina TaxID=299255 RepID=A0A1M5Z517_9GAMM|nr:hydrogen gas-evolving membrane-bound hydrogenase subunit E [Ferrimonas marina]SHI19300.1 multicomponent Na+:H+ antiporter subunit A [Ferrimonas marina]